MKVLGIKQFHQKTFKLLKVKNPEIKGLLGSVPKYFTAVVYGFSGNGKTETCIRLAKELSNHGKVAWLSYEQRHWYDLQLATKRNKMQENTGKFLVIDPIANKPDNMSLLEDLDNYLSKRNSPDYIFFDSVDYTGITWDDYVFLKNKYGNKKGFIFIAHSAKNGKLKKRISEQIIFDGGMGLFVSNYICFPEKNRFGGFDDLIVYEEKARERNPAYFTKRVTDTNPKKKDKGNQKKAS